MGKPSAPAPPDYASAAKATAAGDLEAAKYATYANRANQQTPFGTLSWSADDGTNPGGWRQTIELSPDMQALLQNQTGLSTQYGQQASDLMDRVRAAYQGGFAPPEGLGAVPQLDEAYQGQVVQGIMDRARPQQDYDYQRLQTQLQNQGINASSSPEAYDAAMRQYNAAQNDFRLGAERQAQQEAIARLNSQLGTRERAIQEQGYYQNLPLSTVNALRTGSQPTMPTFGGYAQQATTRGPDLLGAAQNQYGAAMDQYNAQSAASGDFWSGLFGGVSSLASKYSDRRLKRRIRRIGTLPSGLPVYAWRYTWGAPGVGVMADEARALFPDAVQTVAGFDFVDYSKVH